MFRPDLANVGIGSFFSAFDLVSVVFPNDREVVFLCALLGMCGNQGFIFASDFNFVQRFQVLAVGFIGRIKLPSLEKLRVWNFGLRKTKKDKELKRVIFQFFIGMQNMSGALPRLLSDF